MNSETIILGGGFFWCMEGVFQLMKGVEKVVSGYAGGQVINPTYQQICTGNTGHAEVVQISYNPNIIKLEEILDIFFHLHDPTTLNKQGADVGTQYRSVVYYEDENQLPVIEKVMEESQKDWYDRIVTQVEKLDIFYPAEDYHQNYFKNNPDQGYCQLVINPKIAKLKQKYLVKLVD